MRIFRVNIILFMWASLVTLCEATIVFETSTLRLEITSSGVLNSLRDKNSGKEYLYNCGSYSAFSVNKKGQTYNASKVTIEGNNLTVEFGSSGITAEFQTTKNDRYIALTLNVLSAGTVDSINLLQLRVKKLAYLGEWINVVYDDNFGICLCGGNLKTNAEMKKSSSYVDMKTTAHGEVGLEGTTAVLFGFDGKDARNNFLDVMEIVERDFNMPAGARHRRSPIQRYSYLWAASPTVNNIDQYIKLAKRSGLRMILFSYGAFSESAGHFLWNSHYPNRIDDLKRVTDTVRSAGLKLGLHIHYNKAHKTDPYVTPVPDDRFHKIRTFTLATNVDTNTSTINVNENPNGCTLEQARCIIKAGKELIAYTNYTTKQPFQFTGCKRGHLGTTASIHRADEFLDLLDVDDWDVFIRFDQNSDIQDEVAQRIGEIFNRTGPYDMVYFDGAEDVHAPFWYHIANAQYRVYQHFQTKPAVCEAAMNTHFSWHMISRSNAYDVRSEYLKNFCYNIPFRTAPVRALDFTRIEFGWIRDMYDYMGPDDLEYALSRATAWDCPISIQTTPEQVADHPLADDCLNVIRLWEDARINNKITNTQKVMLRTLNPKHYQFVSAFDAVKTKHWIDIWSNTKFTDQEHHLFINEKGNYELVAINEIVDVANSNYFKAYSFIRESEPNNTYVLICPIGDRASIFLPLEISQLELMRPFGTRLPLKMAANKVIVPVYDRRYLVFLNKQLAQVKQILRDTDYSFR